MPAPLPSPFVAAREGGEVNVRYLRNRLVEGWDVNSRDEKSETALIKASRAGCSDVVGLLLSAGANARARSRDGGTALHEASVKGHVGVMELLLQNGADHEARCRTLSQTPLHRAAYAGKAAAADLLLCHNASHLARQKSVLPRVSGTRQEACEDWQEYPDVHDRLGWTALHLAARRGCYHTALTLVDRGALVNTCNDTGSTPLHEACRGAHVKVSLLLRAHGAREEAKDSKGRTPADCVVGGGGINKPVAPIPSHPAENAPQLAPPPCQKWDPFVRSQGGKDASTSLVSDHIDFNF